MLACCVAILAYYSSEVNFNYIKQNHFANTKMGDFMWFKKDEKPEASINEDKDKTEKQEKKFTDLLGVLSQSDDVAIQQIIINKDKNVFATLIFVTGLVNIGYISDYILKPLVQEECFKRAKSICGVIESIENGIIYFPNYSKSTDMDAVLNDILSGQAALLFEQEGTAFVFNVKGFEKRAITETTNENIVKGAKDSFVETLMTNMAMVRRKIKSKQLIIEKCMVGKESRTNIAIFYLKGITDESLVSKLKERLAAIDVDGVMSTGVIEEAVVENAGNPFPQIMNTERPDKFCADILEGRVGMMIDGFPIGYGLPTLFVEFFQAQEDYAYNYVVSSMTRMLRYTLMGITLFLPGFYISVVSFNPDMIPTNLAYAIAQYRTGVTFPTFIETIMMLLSFEIIFEAGNRMPKNIGQVVSVVGALIIGEAAVNAKIVSHSVVIVVALAAISGLAMNNLGFSNALRLWRLGITLICSVLGLVGLVFSLIALLFSLVKLENFGVPYMAPFVSTDGQNMGDALIRLPKKMTNHKQQKPKSIEQVRM